MRDLSNDPTTPLFPSQHGGRLTRDAVDRHPKHVKTAQRECPTLRSERFTMRILRHTAAMTLLAAGIDTAPIALWLRCNQKRTTHVYLHADLELKQRTLDRITLRTSRPSARPALVRLHVPVDSAGGISALAGCHC
jgi:integrase/recombinase XerD